MPDTIYSAADVVTTSIDDSSTVVAFSDGILDLTRDAEGLEQASPSMMYVTGKELVSDARVNGSIMVQPYKFMHALQEYGYRKQQDDVTILVFGARVRLDGIFESTSPISPVEVDAMSQELAAWCAGAGWDEQLVARVQLVLEEKLMNIHDHGLSERERIHEVVSIRLQMVGRNAELTVWDCGTPEPSLALASGSTEVGFELANRKMSGRGRGRMMVRELCVGIERNRYGRLNETIYYIPAEANVSESGGGNFIEFREKSQNSKIVTKE